jgi:hypothetical protein
MLEPRTSPNLTSIRELRPIILPRRDSQDSQWSRYRLHLEDATRVNRTVRSRFVQIGALNFWSLTTASAIGERQSSASLTLAMPRGRWFRMHRFQQDSSKSRSRPVIMSGPLVPLEQPKGLLARFFQIRD